MRRRCSVFRADGTLTVYQVLADDSAPVKLRQDLSGYDHRLVVRGKTAGIMAFASSQGVSTGEETK